LGLIGCLYFDASLLGFTVADHRFAVDEIAECSAHPMTNGEEDSDGAMSTRRSPCKAANPPIKSGTAG
jgi:hypothetical protein